MPGNFSQTLEYLYTRLPMFQRVGMQAFKKDLANTIRLCSFLGDPQAKFMSVHVAGTNGKGSVSHMLASVLQSAGYRTGLYTSPHLKSFTERIRVNGNEVTEDFIIRFVERCKEQIESIEPSFFEVTVAMAFEYFSVERVDVAVIETGMGGRLDSTNVITPLLSVITNVGMDHKDLLGDTVEKIAMQKAGIIKPGVPAIVSERQGEVEQVFMDHAREAGAPLTFASDNYSARFGQDGLMVVCRIGHTRAVMTLRLPLEGWYQEKNVPAVFSSVDVLRTMGYRLPDRAIRQGLEETVAQTGLKGRWQKLGDKPLIICDTGHNAEGITEVLRQLKSVAFKRLFILWGMVKDKPAESILAMLPKEATYIFVRAGIPRALDAEVLLELGRKAGLTGEAIGDVGAALQRARRLAGPDDLIFIGGSTFVVAELDGL